MPIPTKLRHLHQPNSSQAMTALLHLPRLSRSRSLEGWHTGSGTVPKFPVDSIKKRVGQLLDSPKYFPLPVVLSLSRCCQLMHGLTWQTQIDCLSSWSYWLSEVQRNVVYQRCHRGLAGCLPSHFKKAVNCPFFSFFPSLLEKKRRRRRRRRRTEKKKKGKEREKSQASERERQRGHLELLAAPNQEPSE